MSVCNEDSILNKTFEMWYENKLILQEKNNLIKDMKKNINQTDQRSYNEGYECGQKNILII